MSYRFKKNLVVGAMFILCLLYVLNLAWSTHELIKLAPNNKRSMLGVVCIGVWCYISHRIFKYASEKVMRTL